MKTYRGDNGTVYARVKGEWEPIGSVDFVHVEVPEGTSDEDVLRIASEAADDDFESITEVDIDPDDIDGMYEFVYRQWLFARFPALTWN